MAQEQRSNYMEMTDDDILKGIGMRLGNLRKRRDLGQDEVAAATGIGVSTLSRYERGRAKYPELAKLYRLCDFYGVEPEWLFGELWRTRVLSNGELQPLRLIEGKGAGQGPIQGSLFVAGVTRHSVP